VHDERDDPFCSVAIDGPITTGGASGKLGQCPRAPGLGSSCRAVSPFVSVSHPLLFSSDRTPPVAFVAVSVARLSALTLCI
jgi:hypothetical protein